MGSFVWVFGELIALGVQAISWYWGIMPTGLVPTGVRTASRKRGLPAELATVRLVDRAKVGRTTPGALT